MERNRTFWQGLGIIVFGLFFLILSSIFYVRKIIEVDRLIIFSSLSIVLMVFGVVFLVLSRRIPSRSNGRKQRQKA